MSDETKDLTPREVRLCRDAVERTVNEIWPHVRRATGSFEWEGSEPLAERLYPMPTVEVPREVELRGARYRICDGDIQILHEGKWKHSSLFEMSYVRVLADLLASPTHRVPADEVTP